MLKAVLLICALDVAPANCLPDSALDMIAGPETGDMAACGLHAQAFLAQSALAQSMGEGEYLKIVCLSPDARLDLTRRSRDPAADEPFAGQPDLELAPAAGVIEPLHERPELQRQ